MGIAMNEAQISNLYDKYADAIDRAVSSMPGMPVFDECGSLDATCRDYMIMLVGALLVCGVPIDEASELAVSITSIVSSPMRENLGREVGHC